jgi:hypothetical protein
VYEARRIALTAALAAITLASAAAAAGAAMAAGGAKAGAGLAPGRSGFYGGGAVRDYLQFVSLRVTPDARLSAHATLVTKCAPRFGDELTESVSVRNGRLSDTGRYSATTSFSDQMEPGVAIVGGLKAEGTIAVTARVLAGGVARGVVRVRTVYTDPASGAERSRCDTGRIPWEARRPSPDAGAGDPVRQPGTFRGTTDQDEPFLMKVAPDGRLVRRAGMTVRVGCPSGIGLPLDVVAHRLRVRRGRFGARDEFQRAFTYPDGRQVVERYTFQLRGRFGRRGARGTFELGGTVHRRRDGEQIGSCDTGAIAWRASR